MVKTNKDMKYMKTNIMVAAAALAVVSALSVSCATGKKANDGGAMNAAGGLVTGGNAGNNEAVKSAEMLDDDCLVLSDEQYNRFVDGSNRFAFKLFKHTLGLESEVVSPLSVSYLMGMLANGASGQTLDEIVKTMGCEGMSVDDINAACKTMMQRAASADASTVVNVANYVALNRQYRLKGTFSAALADSYSAGVEQLDFTLPQTPEHINEWCASHTGGMIPQIVDDVDPGAVSYIMNAIYFNGTWADKFDKSMTKTERFRGYTRDVKRVPMMHNNGKYMYCSRDGYAAVAMPYGNGSYRMTVVLPDEGKGVSDIMRSFDEKTFASLPRNMSECIVDLKLPRFTTNMTLPLNDIVSSLGAPTMFGPEADFSRLADGRMLVSKMLQKAKIEVSEEGTKAAAVTVAIMTTTALAPQPLHVDFHADRPFAYIISDSATGTILFMGQYAGD